MPPSGGGPSPAAGVGQGGVNVGLRHVFQGGVLHCVAPVGRGADVSGGTGCQLSGRKSKVS